MKYLLLVLSALAYNVTFGQNKTTPNLDTFLRESILKGMSDEAKLGTKKNTAHFYTIALAFDKNGKIDTLYFSEKLNANTKLSYGLNSSLLRRLKSYNFRYREYSSQIVLIPFYHYNSSDEFIDYKTGFLDDIENLFPEVTYARPIIILKPIISVHIPRTRN